MNAEKTPTRKSWAVVGLLFFVIGTPLAVWLLYTLL